MPSIYKKSFSSFFGNKLKNFFQLLLCHSLVLRQFYSAKINNGAALRSFTKFICILFFSIFLTSCEKVIKVDLNTAEKKYVIEAVITDQPNSCKVLLSQSKNFDEDNTFNGISGAQITITDNNGSAITLPETSQGVYQPIALTGISGHTYNLTVNVDGKTFTATSTMPALVPFDSLYITERTFFDETNKYATLSYKDPIGKGNAYRYIQYVNGVQEKTIFVRDDDLTDGRAIQRNLIYYNNDDDDDEGKLKKGDTVKVDMLCISYPVYQYWYSLSESSTGDSQSATPGNPIYNIQGGALGYFSAHTIQSKTLIVP